jgi:hypothetical protein
MWWENMVPALLHSFNHDVIALADSSVMDAIITQSLRNHDAGIIALADSSVMDCAELCSKTSVAQH